MPLGAYAQMPIPVLVLAPFVFAPSIFVQNPARPNGKRISPCRLDPGVYYATPFRSSPPPGVCYVTPVGVVGDAACWY